MSTDYKNLFEHKKDYSNLFSKKEDNLSNVKRESNMSYKNLFDETKKKPEPELFKLNFPEKIIDPRVKDIQEIDPKISTYAVITWIDRFDENMKNLTKVNQSVSQRELDLAMDFTNGRLCVQSLFTQIKDSLSKLKGPEKKVGILSRFLGSKDEFKLTQDIISSVIQSIRLSLDEYKDKAKYNSTMFLKSEMRVIESDIIDLKSDLECAKIAAIYMVKTEDFKGAVRLEKVKQVSGLVDISAFQLKSAYDLLEKDVEAYENLKDVTIPFLYAKIQTLMSQTLDSEALNMINDIDKL